MTKAIYVFLLWVWVMVLTLAFFGLAEDFLKVQAIAKAKPYNAPCVCIKN